MRVLSLWEMARFAAPKDNGNQGIGVGDGVGGGQTGNPGNGGGTPPGQGGGNPGNGGGNKPVVSVGDVVVGEDGYATITIILDKTSPHPVSFDFTTVDGTASAGADYTSMAGALTFAAGQTLLTVRVPILADATDESNEGFSFAITGARGATIGNGVATVTIRDDDAPVTPQTLETIADEDVADCTVNLLDGVVDLNGDQPWVSSHGELLRADGSVLDSSISGSSLSFDPRQLTDLALGAIEIVSLVYQVTDGSGTASRTLHITVVGANDRPIATDVAYSIGEDGPVGGFAFQASDVDAGAELSYTVLDAVDGLTNNGDGTFGFDPTGRFDALAVGETATVSFGYRVTDEYGASHDATATITVVGANDGPVVLKPVAAETDDNAGVAVIDLVADRATDVDGDVLSVASLGVLRLIDGTVVPYEALADGRSIRVDTSVFDTLQEGAAETLVLSYVVSDGREATAQTLVLTVNGVNDAPTANADQTATLMNSAKLILASQLVGNDTDVEGDALTLVSVHGAVGGAVSFGASTGEIQFVPAAGFSGDGSFMYAIADGHGGIAEAKVTVKVLTTRGNTAPVAVDDFLIGTCGDDTLVGGDGIDTLVGGGGSDTFIGGGGDDTVVTNGGDSINGGGGIDTVEVVGGTGVIIDTGATGVEVVLGGSGGDVLDGSGSGGVLTLIGGGGDDTLTGGAGGGTYSGGVGDDTLNGGSGGGGYFGGAGNDTLNGGTGGGTYSGGDGDDTFTAGTGGGTFTGGAGHDTAIFGGSGGGGIGIGGYTIGHGVGGGWVITGGGGASTTVTGSETIVFDDIEIDIDPTRGCAGTLRIWEDVPVTIPKALLLANDYDADGDPLTIVSVANGPNSTVALDAQGNIRFIGAPDFNGITTFTYTISDGQGGTDDATVTVYIRSVNDAPVAVDIQGESLENDAGTVFAFAATDVDAKVPLRFALMEQPARGTVLNNGDGTFTFVPGDDFNHLMRGAPEIVTFRYKAVDEFGASAMATAQITVIGTNADPVVVADMLTGTEDLALSILPADLLANDSDADGDSLSVVGVGNPVGGTVRLDATTGRIIFTPEANRNGPASFDYTVDDGHGGSVTQMVNITLAAAAPEVPVIAAANLTLAEGVGIRARAMIEDPHNFGSYAFIDDAAGGGHFELDGVEQAAGTEIQVSSADLPRLRWVAGTGGDTVETYQVRGADGGEWGAWQAGSVRTVDRTGTLAEGTVQTYNLGGARSVEQSVALANGNTLALGHILYGPTELALFGPDGTQLSAVQTLSNGYEFACALADGGFLLSTYWATSEPGYAMICRFDAHGNQVGQPQAVNQTPLPYAICRPVGLPDGGWVTISGKASGISELVAQRWDADGRRLGDAKSLGLGYAPTEAIGLSDGRFVISWAGNDASFLGVFYAVCESDGTPVRSGQVNTQVKSYQWQPRVAALANGGFVVVWEDASGQDGSRLGVCGQVFDSGGRRVGSEIQLNTTVFNDQLEPDVAALDDGGFVAVWRSEEAGLWVGHAQRFSATGAKVGGEIMIDEGGQGSELIQRVVALPGGGFMVRWVEELGSTEIIRSKTFAVTGDGADRVLNTSADETLMGAGGVDFYRTGRGYGADLIDNRGHAADGDTIAFGTGVATNQLWFKRVGTDLEVSIVGTRDKVTVDEWYANADNHVSQFRLADGSYLVDAQVENLVSAMAAMMPPPLGQTQLTANQHQQLDPVIAANWQHS